MKKGYILTLDAIIALFIVMVVLTGFMSFKYLKGGDETDFTNLHYVSEDSIEILDKSGVLEEICAAKS